jgi:uncharacterized lipoprotein YajG
MLKLSTWLVVALAAAALMAGCGSSSSTSSTTTTSSQTVTPPANVQQAVTSCEQAVRAQHAISASTKAKLEAICKKAGTAGGQSALQAVAREACIAILNASHVPAGIARERALAVCKTASNGK